MKIIDAHHHLWNIEKNSYPWLVDPIEHFIGDYSDIRRNYLIKDLHQDASDGPYELVKSVHVEAGWDSSVDPVGETSWLQSVADDPASQGMPHAIVGHANFLDPKVEDVLQRHAELKNIRGIRQILNHSLDNPGLNFLDRGDLMDDSQWREGYRRLAHFKLSFDLQIWPWQMTTACRLVGDVPDVAAIINHTGMPLAHDAASRRQWEHGMQSLATHDNVTVKISGLGMATPGWTSEDIRPYVLKTIDIFGVDRCMFASNFPVDRVTSTYNHIWSAFDTITADFTQVERNKLFHDNSAKYYRI